MIKGGEGVSLLLTPKQSKILAIIHEHPDWNQSQVAKEIGVSQTAISRGLKQMRKNNPENEDLEKTIRTYDKRTSYRFYRFQPEI